MGYVPPPQIFLGYCKSVILTIGAVPVFILCPPSFNSLPPIAEVDLDVESLKFRRGVQMTISPRNKYFKLPPFLFNAGEI